MALKKRDCVSSYIIVIPQKLKMYEKFNQKGQKSF